LTQVTLGQSAKISFKAFPGQIFEGQIEGISPLPNKNNFFSLRITLSANANWRLGLTGQAEF
jgi:multidrug resistance efflux pump